MWYWIIKVSILSFILIFLLHYLYSFFISTLTVPKVKDLVTLPQQKYDEMFNSLQQQQQYINTGNSSTNNNNSSSSTNNNSINSNNNTTQSMKDDLINFLKDIGSNKNVEIDNNLEYLPMSNTNTAHNISSYSFTK